MITQSIPQSKQKHFRTLYRLPHSPLEILKVKWSEYSTVWSLKRSSKDHKLVTGRLRAQFQVFWLLTTSKTRILALHHIETVMRLLVVPHPRSMTVTYRLIPLAFVTGLYLFGQLAKLISGLWTFGSTPLLIKKNSIYPIFVYLLAYIYFLYY